jgi:hypothetical protein
MKIRYKWNRVHLVIWIICYRFCNTKSMYVKIHMYVHVHVFIYVFGFSFGG